MDLTPGGEEKAGSRLRISNEGKIRKTKKDGGGGWCHAFMKQPDSGEQRGEESSRG